MSPAAESFSSPTGDEHSIRHVVLIGDGLGDLARLQQKAPGALEGKLMPGRRDSWKLSVLVADQLVRSSPLVNFPADATHIVISIEGNRAIHESGLLDGKPASMQEGLARLSYAADQFEDKVEVLIHAAQATRLPTVICSMWPPRYPEPTHQRAAVAALGIFNSRILRRAVEARISLVDLRPVCSDREDYADHIMLSRAGLQKAANLIGRALFEASRRGPGTEVFS
jgi:hypothetical protein